MKNIGMVVAVEIQAVLNRYGTQLEELSFPGYRVKKYRTDRYNLFVLDCGAGEIAAAAGTQFLITQFNVELVVNFGVVGGLTDEMHLAKTCIVERIVHYDFDTSALDYCEVGRYMNYPSVYIPATPELVRRAVELCPSLKPVTCASGDKFVDGAEQKQRLHAAFDADICEMEAAGIALTCNRCGVPCLFIKTVSDAVTGGAEEFRSQVGESAGLCLEVADRLIGDICWSVLP